MTHCVHKAQNIFVNIGSGNGDLSLARHKVMIWTNAYLFNISPVFYNMTFYPHYLPFVMGIPQ